MSDHDDEVVRWYAKQRLDPAVLAALADAAQGLASADTLEPEPELPAEGSAPEGSTPAVPGGAARGGAVPAVPGSPLGWIGGLTHRPLGLAAVAALGIGIVAWAAWPGPAPEATLSSPEAPSEARAPHPDVEPQPAPSALGAGLVRAVVPARWLAGPSLPGTHVDVLHATADGTELLLPGLTLLEHPEEAPSSVALEATPEQATQLRRASASGELLLRPRATMDAAGPLDVSPDPAGAGRPSFPQGEPDLTELILGPTKQLIHNDGSPSQGRPRRGEGPCREMLIVQGGDKRILKIDAGGNPCE